MKRIILLLLLLTCNATLMAQQHAVILQYHHIAKHTPFITSTRPELFRWQMDYLKQQAYQVLPLSQVIDSLKHKQELPEKTVVITFDDAYQSIYDTALPILKKNKFPFSIFVNTDAISFAKNQLSWQQLNQLTQYQGEILNHSASHTHFIRQKHAEDSFQWRQRIRNEIEKSQSTIEYFIGSTPKILAYPYGEYSLEIVQLIKDMGYAGLGQHSGPAGFGMPLEILPRFPMGGHYGEKAQFIEKLHTLPLALKDHEIFDPITKNSEQPVIILSLANDNNMPTHNFQCYVSGQGKAQLKWDSAQTQVMIQAKKPLKAGRNRYNCTMPVSNSPDKENYYYWLSQLWITPRADGSWYQE
jgi:peptidoglycan/xylan/chitin deacetylase (PgdA/CDA1 family)